MFSHVTIGSNAVQAAGAFYDAVLKEIGFDRLYDEDDSALGYGSSGDIKLWIMNPFNGQSATAGNGQMTAFLAASRSAVDGFYAAALENGGSDEGAPGLRPHYHENYYAAYVRDPEGNKICVVCHTPES